MRFEKNYAVAYFKRRKKIWYTLETLIITLFLLWLSLLISPEDPFSLTGPVSWLILVPMFCSLLYGSSNGLIALSILLTYLMYYNYMYPVEGMVLRQYCVGISFFTVISGLFSSYWQDRIRHIEHLNRYVREHLEDLSRDYYQLKISHERIEHAYISKPMSFRDAFLQIREALLQHEGDISSDIGEHLLNIFSQYCSINSAMIGIYYPKKKVFEPLASIGKEFILDLSDPLIEESLKNNVSSYIAINSLGLDTKSHYIAVLPLLDTKRKTRGLIVIKDMPFWSLTHDNLEVLSVFAATFALQWTMTKKVGRLLEVFPQSPPEFIRELDILIHLRKFNSVQSAIAGLVVPQSNIQENILYSLEQNKRSLDYTWILPIHKAKLYLVLLPLTSQAGILGYKKRLLTWLTSEFGEQINRNGYRFRYQLLSKETLIEQLNEFIEVCSHDSH